MSKLVIIDYGAGNIKSLQFALARLEINAECTKNPELIKKAEKVIFPGVGHAESAMKKLKESGLDILLPKLKQPVLGICLGMQLMCNYSEEGSTQGLGIFNVEVERFQISNKVPHMGWNTITKLQTPLFQNIPEQSFMYFVHSYFVPNNSHSIATTAYEIPYCSALAKDNFYGVQFHPEKSGPVGQKILENFLTL